MAMNGKIAGFAIVLLLVAVGTASADDRRILDLLLKKGLITRAEYEDVLKEAAAEPVESPKAAASADSNPNVPAAPAPPIGSYKDLERVPGGIENLRKNDYRNVFTTLDSILKHNERVSLGIVALKAQYNADNTDRKPSSATADTANNQGTLRDENGFRIGAAEFYITGRLTPWSTYYFEVDFARQNEIALNSMIMDFYAKDMPYLKSLYPYISKVRVGQFWHPFGIEQGITQGLIDFVNRAYYTDLRTTSVSSVPGDPGLNPFGKTNGGGFVQ